MVFIITTIGIGWDYFIKYVGGKRSDAKKTKSA